MYNNPNAMFAFRNGDYNVAYSNFFIKSGGLRFKQSNNIFCYNIMKPISNSNSFQFGQPKRRMLGLPSLNMVAHPYSVYTPVVEEKRGSSNSLEKLKR
jgi:hypothetical protein